jgi:protein FAM50
MENLFRDDTRKVKKRKKTAKATLSFALDDDGEGTDSVDTSERSTPKEGSEEPASKRSKFRKNPNVDTSFLPDREREEAERKEREHLRQEWLKKQEEMKQEDIEITYSYWDGSGHRKSVTVRRLLLDFATPLMHITYPVQER